MKLFFRRWASEKARSLTVPVLILIGLFIFYPADLGAKLTGAAFAFAVLLGTSFIPDLGRKKKRPLDEMRVEADARALEELPSAASIDVMRPLLAVHRTDAGPITIHMIKVPMIHGEVPVMTYPEHKFGRRVEIVELPDFAHLRKYLNEQHLRVVPQGGLADELGPKLFGDDWREE